MPDQHFGFLRCVYFFHAVCWIGRCPLRKEKFQVVRRLRIFFERFRRSESRALDAGRRILKMISYTVICFVSVVAKPVFAQPIGSSATFSIVQHGLVSFASSNPASITTGYASIQIPSSTNGRGLPYGLTIIGDRQDGVLVSEASVPAQALVNSSRMYVEVAGAANTGIAIANPNTQPARITFYFTDANGNDSAQNSVTIPPNRQIACYISQPPF